MRVVMTFLAVYVIGCRTPETRQSIIDASTEDACVDQWLAEHALDDFGSPKGTMYAGGNPLFDEMSGETVSRLDHVYRKHPDARRVCARDAERL